VTGRPTPIESHVNRAALRPVPHCAGTVREPLTAPTERGRVKARDVMTSPVIVLRPETPAREAAELLCAHGFAAAPVVDGEHRIVGMATEADCPAPPLGPAVRGRGNGVTGDQVSWRIGPEVAVREGLRPSSTRAMSTQHLSEDTICSADDDRGGTA
jgi:CBS-domain-containing membrane protein